MPAAVESALRSCPFCGADNRAQPASPYSHAPWELKTCAACGFVYLENPPGYTELEENFAWEKTSAAEEARRDAERPLAKRLSRAFRHFRQRVLKRDKLHRPALPAFAARQGARHRLRRRRRHWPAARTATSRTASKSPARWPPQANALAQARGGRVVQANAIAGLAQFAPDSLDAALLSGFLEHETQPALLLRELRRVLRPGAPVIVKVPNYGCINRVVRGAKWCGFRHPDHVNYFTPAQPRAAGRRLRLPRRALHLGRPLAAVGQPLGRAAKISDSGLRAARRRIELPFPLFKVYQPFFKYLRPYRWTLILATICGIIAGVSSGIGLPFILNNVLSQAFGTSANGAAAAPAAILLASKGSEPITQPKSARHQPGASPQCRRAPFRRIAGDPRRGKRQRHSASPPPGRFHCHQPPVEADWQPARRHHLLRQFRHRGQIRQPGGRSAGENSPDHRGRAGGRHRGPRRSGQGDFAGRWPCR